MEDLIGIWRGPFSGQTARGTTVAFGAESPVTEADLESSHWERAGGQSAPAPEPAAVLPEPVVAPATEEPA